MSANSPVIDYRCYLYSSGETEEKRITQMSYRDREDYGHPTQW